MDTNRDFYFLKAERGKASTAIVNELRTFCHSIFETVVASEDALTDIVALLNEKAAALKKEHPRWSGVEVKFSKVSSGLETMGWITAGPDTLMYVTKVSRIEY